MQFFFWIIIQRWMWKCYSYDYLTPPIFPPTKMEWGCGLLVLITTFTPILFYLYRSYHTSLNKFDPGHICIRDPSYDQNFHRHICRDVIVSCINIGGIFYHPCLNFLFIIIFFRLCVWNFDNAGLYNGASIVQCCQAWCHRLATLSKRFPMTPIQEHFTTLFIIKNNTYFVAVPHLYNTTFVEAISVPFLSVTFNRTVSEKICKVSVQYQQLVKS